MRGRYEIYCRISRDMRDGLGWMGILDFRRLDKDSSRVNSESGLCI